jgi:hypothetical protein
VSTSAPAGTLYARLASLPLEVEGYELQRLEREVSSGFTRVTTVVTLQGGGLAGCGEDVTYMPEDHEGVPAVLQLAGRHTVASFAALFDGLQLFPRSPQLPASHDYRRWAFESAALDLALRQSGRSLGAALGRPYRPVRFVVSTRLDVRSWLALYPQLEFKLDPTPEWDPALTAAIAATGRVRVVDFKAFYEGTPVDNPPDAALYARIVAAFPEAIVEDAALSPDTRGALAPALGRLSFDAPVHSWEDVGRLPVRPAFLNIKPSRFGTLARLLDCVERASAAGIGLYGGGQFELGPGRGQIQALASLLYAEAPNDVAPAGYNEPEPRPGLPSSPLAPPAEPLGFSWTGA